MLKYADLYKNSKDFFERTFSFGHTLEMSAKTEFGPKIKGEATVNKDKDTPFAVKLAVSGFRQGMFSVDKVEFAQDQSVVGEFSLTDAAPGTKLTFKCKEGSRAAAKVKRSAKVGVEFQHELFSAVADVDVVSGPAITAALLTSVQDVFVGAAVATNASTFELSQHDVLAAYRTAGTTFGAFTEQKFGALTAFLHHRKDKLTFTGRAGVATGFGKPDAAKITPIQFGAQYMVAPDTKVSGTVDVSGNVRVAYDAKLCPAATLTVSAAINPLELHRDGQVGTKLVVSQ